MDCVASMAWLDQMFYFAAVTSNSVSSQRFSGGIDVKKSCSLNIFNVDHVILYVHSLISRGAFKNKIQHLSD